MLLFSAAILDESMPRSSIKFKLLFISGLACDLSLY